MVARSVYAFNWYNVGAVLPLIGTSLGIGTARLGIVLGAFLVGAGVFQLPAGIAALRWGNRRVCLVALAVMGAFALASAFSPNWMVLAGLRFGAGAGAAFFFAPALGLVASYYPAGARGPVIGLYNAGFAAGAGIGVIAGAFVGAAFGWPWALAVGGAGLLVAAAWAAAFLPAVPPPSPAPSTRAALRLAWPALRSRALWALGLGLTGAWAASYILAQYTVEYASVAHPAWSLPLAATLPTLFVLVEIPGAPVGGWLGERVRSRVGFLAIVSFASAAVIFLVPFLDFPGLVAVFTVFGVGSSVAFAVLYLLPSYLPGMAPESLSFALALINGIQILLGSGLAIGFGFVAEAFGYTAAWYYAGALAVATLAVLVVLRPTDFIGEGRAAAGASRPE